MKDIVPVSPMGWGLSKGWRWTGLVAHGPRFLEPTAGANATAVGPEVWLGDTDVMVEIYGTDIRTAAQARHGAGQHF
jgi:hypothetical protein